MEINNVFTKVFSTYSEANKWCKKLQKYGFNPYIFSAIGGYNISVLSTPIKNKALEAESFLVKLGLNP